MKFEWNKKYNTAAIYTFLTLAVTIMFALALKNLDLLGKNISYAAELIKPILYGIAIAYVLNPMMSFFENKVILKSIKKVSKKSARTISIILTYISVFLIVGVLFWIIIPEVGISISNIAGKILNFINHIDSYTRKLSEMIPFHEIPPEIFENFSKTITSLMMNLYSFVSNAVPQILNFTVKISTGFVKFILGIIVSIYVLIDKEVFFAQIKKFLSAFLSREKVNLIIELTHEGNDIFSGFISGKILDSFIIGMICFVSMTLLKIPSAMLVSVLVGVTNVIPYFGPFIGAIPSAMIILVDSPSKAFLFVFLILIIQQFDGNILGPKILGDSTGLSAFWVIFAILFFGGAFNIVGMFIGVPTFAVIYNLIKRIVNYRLTKKNMPTDSKSYAELGKAEENNSEKSEKQ